MTRAHIAHRASHPTSWTQLERDAPQLHALLGPSLPRQQAILRGTMVRFGQPCATKTRTQLSSSALVTGEACVAGMANRVRRPRNHKIAAMLMEWKTLMKILL